ncbi:MAG: DAHL domain-containing protein [Cyanobacteria bacterium J06633_8]
MAYLQKWGLFNKLRSLSSNQKKTIVTGSVSLSVLLLFFLISKSFPANFEKYQQYRDSITKFREVDLTFNQELLKSRYELFADYDPLVRSIAKQKVIQQKLQKIPDFIPTQKRQEIELILKEIRTVIAKRENLSERFKSQNALLKNSLRYLPILTDKLSTKLDGEEETKVLQQNQSTALKNTLNALIRNLLLYNITVDKQLRENIDNLIGEFSQLQLQYELSEEEFPSQLVKAHTNVIVTTKPKIEELTTQLLQSLEQNTESLETKVEDSYQQVTGLVNLYRLLTFGWFILVLALINYLLMKRLRRVDPEFSKYKKQIENITAVLTGILKKDKVSSDTIITNKLVNLSERQDELGELARGIEEIAVEVNKESTIGIEESAASLTARLTLLTENRKKFISPIALEQLEIIIGDALEKSNCKMIDFRGNLEQVQILFRYPPQIQLSELVTHLKAVSASYFYEKLQDIIDCTEEGSKIWCDSSSITSCESVTV